MLGPQNRPLRVFLCHSSNDKPTVRELYRRLSAEDWIDPWLDEEKLFPGMDWNLEIEKAVEAADAILVCLSNNSITKEGYVQRELRVVLDYADYKPEGTLYVIPVRLEACEPPRRLRPWQYADYFPKEDRNHAYQRLLVSLRMRAESLGILNFNQVRERAEPRVEELKGDEPKGIQPDWYVIHCYSGYENKVRHNLEQRIEIMGMKDKIFDVVIPIEEEIEVRDGKRRTVERNIYPGYVLVNMQLTEESWDVVRNTPGVTGFVGMGNRPTPLTPGQVKDLIGTRLKGDLGK